MVVTLGCGILVAMAGHIEKRVGPRGTHYRVVVPLTSERNSRKVVRHVSGKGARLRAIDILSELQIQVRGGFVPPAKLTIGEVFDKWLVHIEGRVAPATSYLYNNTIETHLRTPFGQIRAAELRPTHLDTYYTEKRKTVSAATVHHHYRILHAALEFGVTRELLARNVADISKPPRAKPAERKTLSANEMLALVAQVRGTPLFYPVLLAVSCGLRAGEVFALRVGDVNVESAIITVRRARDLTPGAPSLKEPKSGKPRLVPIPDFALPDLRIAVGASDDFVCPQIPHQDFNADFRMLMDGLGHEGFRFHDLRHSYLTLLAEGGLPARAIQAAAGHQDASTTAGYTHATERMRDMHIELVNRAFDVETDSRH
jgi:integrase